MTDWKLAMVMVLPMMWGGAKPRAWAVVMLSSVLSALVGVLEPRVFLAIDLVCGALILARPAGCAQRAIGMLFAMMALFDVGYIISPRLDGGAQYYTGLSALGWVQFAILAAWGAHDTGRLVVGRLGPSRHSLARGAGTR
jgi:hypothetical protein